MSFDKSVLIPCPILHPSIVEFENPMSYLSRPDIAKLGAEYGIVKLVPPQGWKPPFLLSPMFKFHTRLQKLSDLGLTTRSRTFFKNNINRFLKMRNKRPLRLYFLVKDNVEHDQLHQEQAADPNKKKTSIKVYYYDLYVAIDKLGGSGKMTEDDWAAINVQFGVPRSSRQVEEEYNANIKAYALFLANNNIKKYNFNSEVPNENAAETKMGMKRRKRQKKHQEQTGPNGHHDINGEDVDAENEDSEEEKSDNCLICSKNDNPSETLLCDNCDKPYHMSCLEPKLNTVPSGSWFCDKCLIGTGEYGFKEDVDLKYTLPEFYDMCQEFDKEFQEEYNNGQPLTVDIIEQKFWEFVGQEKSDMEVKYGADIHNLTPGEISGFPMSNTPGLPLHELIYQLYVNHPFNLTKLPFSQGSLMKFINTSISGMTIPWIYIGSLLSTFCWHVEDHYTLSINYCHFGATKKWYGIPSSQAGQFEKLMKDSAPDLFQRQPDLLHQLVTLLSPTTLVENGIRCVYADQQPNEFIITYPKVYHSGFNCGFNFNEAVNFTIEPWLEFGEQAILDYKEIKKENVFNHYQLLENILRKFLNEARESQFESKNSNKLKKEFVVKCLNSFEKFYVNQLNNIWDLNQKRYQIQYKLRDFRKRDFVEEQNGLFKDENDEKNDPEQLCDGCKTHLAYQYFSVPNKDQQFTIKKHKLEDKEKEREKDKENDSYLPTPRSSPQERTTVKEESEEIDQIKDSVSSRRMTLITGDGESESVSEQTKLSEEEEFKRLISSAKKSSSSKEGSPEEDQDAAAAASNQKKRRRSTRIQKQEQTEIMSLGSSKKVLQMVHEKLQLQLCADCIGVYNKDLPIGTVLIYEHNPEEIQKLIHTVKREIMKM